ncbi:MAG TPA: response regulator [Acidobacteriaceae bacterium]|nr:response regulator [Acidobacteriaceae bacterium]
MSTRSIADRRLENATAAKTVLIADDEATITQTLSLILERNGYRTVVAPTGEEAVQLVRASAPDVVISDIIMPGITGIEAAIQIRALCPECRILLISGETISEELLEKA